MPFGYWRMRSVLALLALLSGTCTKAQSYMPALAGNIYLAPWTPLPATSQLGQGDVTNQRWFVSQYAAVSAGATFYPGGSATFISVPIGLQLNRQINSNLYAFAGVYAAPTVASFNQAFLHPSYNNVYPYNFSNQYGAGINTGIQMGLMHVNDAGTFSISGSINIERGYYPVYPAAPRSNLKRQ